LYAAYLRARLGTVPDADVAAHLAEHPALWSSPGLRERWLMSFAQRREWKRFLELYDEAFARTTDAHLMCRALWARHALGGDSHWDEDALAVWLVGVSQPKECDPVFTVLEQAGLLTERRYRERLALALEGRQLQLAAYLARQLGADERESVARWRRMHADPMTQLTRTGEFSREEDQKLIAYGLKRLARLDPDQAEQVWPAWSRRMRFGDEENAAIRRDIALWSARRHDPQALERLAAITQRGRDDTLAGWYARAAIRAGDWTRTLAGIERLSDDAAGSSTWRYWQARALKEEGKPALADQIFLALAQERSYYGFLAADRLGLRYAMNHRPVQADTAILADLQRRPDLVRARELFAVGLDAGGRIEWERAMRGLAETERAQASLLASTWGWHSRAIATASSGGLNDDLEIRYPIAFSDLFESLAPRAGVPVTWAYGIARSESLFMPDVSSPAGAIGLMQLMPETGRLTARQTNITYSGPHSLTDPRTNITLGTRYLGSMLERFQDNRVLATAAYNAGPNRVERWLPERDAMAADVWIETIPYGETRTYVQRVLAAEAIFSWRLHGQPLRLDRVMGDVPGRELTTNLVVHETRQMPGGTPQR
jgi:soluble lytic murein transglycosylase